MHRYKMDFLEPGWPFIIIRKLTIEIIEKAIHTHTQDNHYWLNLYHFSGSIKSDMFNELQEDEYKPDDLFDVD